MFDKTKLESLELVISRRQNAGHPKHKGLNFSRKKNEQKGFSDLMFEFL